MQIVPAGCATGPVGGPTAGPRPHAAITMAVLASRRGFRTEGVSSMRRTPFIALAFIASLAPLAPGFAQTSQDPPQFPKGFEVFLSEMAQLMKKYPLAAETFSLRDNSSKPQGAHRVCCEWLCDWGDVNCRCKMECPK
jgi:hypothetical protein